MEIAKREYVGLKVSEAMLAQLGINGAVNGRDYDCMCRDDRNILNDIFF
jgi:hypothetical protein